MNAAKLLEQMSDAGFSVVLRIGKIEVRPANKITPALRADIREHRDELAALLESVEREAADLIERLRRAAPHRWTDADVEEAQRNTCRDYPAGLNCLRALTASKT